MKLVYWAIALAVVLFVVDRLLLWCETRGWIFYRRTKGRGGGAIYHTLEMHSVFDPGIEQVIEARVKEEQSEDESGEPPVGEGADPRRRGRAGSPRAGAEDPPDTESIVAPSPDG